MKTRGQRGRGRSQTTLDLIHTCREIIAEVAPITVRGVAYRLFVAKKIDSMAVKNTQKISRLLVELREEGLISWDSIVDDSRWMERDPHWFDVKDYSEAVENSYRRDFWGHQRNKVVVISEKSTVAGILRPVLKEYGVPFFAAHGFSSSTTVHEMARQIRRDRRRHVFLYVGDYDCSGMHMSEVDLPDRLERYGAGGFLLKRVALTREDIRGGDLKSFEAKQRDPRFQWYARHYGEEAWELDAMDPTVLRDRVREEIKRFVDEEEWERHRLTEKAEKETIKMIAGRMLNLEMGDEDDDLSEETPISLWLNRQSTEK